MNEKLDSNNSEVEQNGFIKMAEQVRSEAPIEAKKHFKEARQIEFDFVKRNEAIKESGETMSKKEFERWEDELAFELKLGQRQVEIGNMNFDAEADAKREIVTYHEEEDIAKTIEAQAGNYFYERERDLELKLREQGSEDELKFLRGFYHAVEQHLDFKYMTRDERMEYDYDRYDRQRTEAHNNAIKHLNGLNDLARKYGTRPFTVRNFWPSDMRERSAQTPEMAAVMRYDRDVLEEYYAIAFGSDVARREAKLRRDLEMGIY